MNTVLFVMLLVWILFASVGLIVCGRLLHTAHIEWRRLLNTKRTDAFRARKVVARGRITQERIAVVIQLCYLYTGLAIVLSQSGTAWRWTWPLALMLASGLQVVSSLQRKESKDESLRVLDEELTSGVSWDFVERRSGSPGKEE